MPFYYACLLRVRARARDDERGLSHGSSTRRQAQPDEGVRGGGWGSSSLPSTRARGGLGLFEAVGCAPCDVASQLGWAEAFTSQLVPNWSTHMPKVSPQGAFSKGIVTVPFSLSRSQ
jgi:hypothetical protein